MIVLSSNPGPWDAKLQTLTEPKPIRSSLAKARSGGVPVYQCLVVTRIMQGNVGVGIVWASIVFTSVSMVSHGVTLAHPPFTGLVRRCGEVHIILTMSMVAILQIAMLMPSG